MVPNISAANIIPVNIKAERTSGTYGISNRNDASIAPISAPMFMVLAIRRRDVIEYNNSFE